MANGQRRVALHKARLTTRTVADARPRERRYIVWDEELTGFGLRVSPSGRRSFIVQYRAAARTHEELREASQAIADRVEALAFSEMETAQREPAR